ncbi:MAG TPA: family 16 glycoside hydrolase [Terracidiphilus sp.]|nr:family 16 glycoside hydrolase [Terracidiphilus sp.]
MKSSHWKCTGLLLAAFTLTGLYAQEPQGTPQPPPPLQAFALIDTKDLVEHGVKAEATDYLGRRAVRLTRQEEGDGQAILTGTNFRDGIIEVDVATKITRPPGVRMPGFTGVAFRSRGDGTHYELFYLRPGNALSEDQAMRNHSVQYSSEPDFGWEKLRRNWPSVYETYAELQPETWTHVKIEVHGRRAKLYLNGSARPSLVVDGLKGEDLEGPIALWGYNGEESYFSNLKVENAKPDPIEDGGEAAGTWDVQCNTDAGTFGGTMKLVREGNTIVGLWNGAFGPDQQVNGVWRDGYVELTFSGSWPEQPGAVTATLVGWVDGDGATGRMKVEGRADGKWTAVRKK